MAVWPLDADEIDEPPPVFLARHGEVFATFGPATQDSGNVSFGVRFGDARVFVKTAGDPAGARPVPHARRVALLENAVRLHLSCDHPSLARLHRVVGSPWGPLLVHEWLEGELLYAPAARRRDPRSAFQRFRALPADALVARLGEVVHLHAELERLGWLAVDFYDGSLVHDFATGRLSVIDLDHYARGPFENDIGRLPGSERFLAPEELTLGATIDERTTVHALGRLGLVFLGDGARALRDVAARACDPDAARRFASVAALLDAWREAAG